MAADFEARNQRELSLERKKLLRPPWELAPCGHRFDQNCTCEFRNLKLRGSRDFLREFKQSGGGFLHEPWRAVPYRMRVPFPREMHVWHDAQEIAEFKAALESKAPTQIRALQVAPDPVAVSQESLPPGSVKQIGLNQTKLGGQESPTFDIRTGNDSSILNDCAFLEASVIRQFGMQDILWLYAEDASGRHYPPVPVRILDIDTYWSTALSKLETLLNEMVSTSSSVRLSLTFLTWGGGDTTHVLEPGDHSYSEAWEACIELPWHRDHRRNLIESSDLSDRALSFLPEFLAWGWPDLHLDPVNLKLHLITGLHSLDPRDPYKIVYLAFLSRSCAEGLVRTIDACGISDVSRLIRHIEIFNEIEMRNVAQIHGSMDTNETARCWALIYYVVARVFRTVLDSNEATRGLPLYLPALSSAEKESREIASWEYKREFLFAMLRWLSAVPGVQIENIVAGIDLHFYHRWKQPPPDSGDHQTLHIAWLGRGVEEIHAILSFFLQDPTISIMESGVSSGEDIYTLTPVPSEDYCPPGLSREDFQAQEVVRRIGGALASRARLAGWHSWMPHLVDTKAKPPRVWDEWSGTGLREENTLSGDRADLSVQKPSWHAFRRIARLLNRVVHASFLFPDITEAEDVFSDQIEKGLVILSFLSTPVPAPLHRESPSLPWTYLLFIDPMEPRGELALEQKVQVRVPSDTDVTEWSWAISSTRSVIVGDNETLPLDLVEYQPPLRHDRAFVLQLVRYELPVVLRSSAHLSFTFRL